MNKVSTRDRKSRQIHVPTNSMVIEAPHSAVVIVVPFDSNLFPDGVHAPWYTKIGSRSSTTVIAIVNYVDQRRRLVMCDGIGVRSGVQPADGGGAEERAHTSGPNDPGVC